VSMMCKDGEYATVTCLYAIAALYGRCIVVVFDNKQPDLFIMDFMNVCFVNNNSC
jgi:hypothetical protein